MSGQIIYVKAEQFEREVLQSDQPVVVDFYSEGCPPCQVLSPIYEQMAEKYQGSIKFVKIFRQGNPDLAKSLNVISSPTVLFFKEGREIETRLGGFLSKLQLRKAIETIFGESFPEPEVRREEVDVIILGAGAAGLSAAIYTARAKLKTVVLDESVPGGQIASTYHVANYPGTPGVVMGVEIIENIRAQAQSFGAVIEDLKEILEVQLAGPVKSVMTDDAEYFGKAVIIATGAQPKPLPAEGADEFKGRGVHYCATCDGALYRERNIVVFGGGDSAVEEAIFLTRFASQVTIIHQFDHFQAGQLAQDEAFRNPKINIIWDSEVRKVNGQSRGLSSVVIENLKTKELTEVPAEGAFVFIGTTPRSELYRGQVALDDWGHVIAGEDTKTNVEGVFVAGDIRSKPIRQVVTAASDGAVAGIMAEKYLGGRFSYEL